MVTPMCCGTTPPREKNGYSCHPRNWNSRRPNGRKESARGRHRPKEGHRTGLAVGEFHKARTRVEVRDDRRKIHRGSRFVCPTAGNSGTSSSLWKAKTSSPPLTRIKYIVFLAHQKPRRFSCHPASRLGSLFTALQLKSRPRYAPRTAFRSNMCQRVPLFFFQSRKPAIRANPNGSASRPGSSKCITGSVRDAGQIQPGRRYCGRLDMGGAEN